MLYFNIENTHGKQPLPIASADGHTFRWSSHLLHFLTIPVFCSNPKQCPKSADAVFICFVFWHNQYIAPPKFCQAVCLERNPVCWSIFIQTWKSHWHLSTSWRKKIILSAVYRVSSPAMLPVPLDRDARESASAKKGSRVNHGVMKQIYSGLSEIQLFKLISLFTLVFHVVKSYGLSFGSSKQGIVAFLCFPCLFFHFICWSHPIFYCYSCVVAELDLWFVLTYLPDGWGLQHIGQYKSHMLQPITQTVWKTSTWSFNWSFWIVLMQ